MSTESQSTTSTEGDVPCEFGGCPRTFKSRRAMKVHHSKKHGEPLADHICDHCDEPFASRRPEQRFCDEECEVAEKRSNQVALTCDCCYITFNVRPSFSHLRHCSTRCRAIAQRFNYGAGDKIQQKTRPGTLKELVRHAYVYEGHSFEATCRIVDHELDGDHSREEIDDIVSELMSHERNVRNRVWALRPEDLGLSPIGEVA